MGRTTHLVRKPMVIPAISPSTPVVPQQAARDCCMQRGISIASRLFVLGLGLIPAVAMADGMQVTNARVPISDQIGVDLPFLMTIKNDAPEADAILRVRCPIANFSEKHTVDRGEGAPAMRAVKSIPIPAGQTTELKRDGHHIMLLQTRQKLTEGETFTCAVVFQKAGTKETEVQVSRSP